MTDIVERLRRGDPCGDCKRDRCACVIMEDAADTITDLRAEVERLVKSRNRWGQKYNKLLNAVRTENAFGVYSEARDEYRQTITKLAAENEKLRNDVRLAVMSDSKECTLLTEENAALTARVKELEAALHRISLGSQNSGTTKEDLGREARAAITQPAEKGGE